MSQENVDILRHAFEHYDTTGEHLVEIYAPEFVWDMTSYRDWPEPEIYEGVEGLRRFFADWKRVFDWDYEVESFHELGECAVFVVRMQARAKETGLEFTWPAGHLWTVRDGKITRMAIYSDAAEALRDAGLP